MLTRVRGLLGREAGLGDQQRDQAFGLAAEAFMRRLASEAADAKVIGEGGPI